MAIATVNPATGEVIKKFEPLTAEQIEQKLQLAASAFRPPVDFVCGTGWQNDARGRDSGKGERRVRPFDDA